MFSKEFDSEVQNVDHGNNSLTDSSNAFWQELTSLRAPLLKVSADMPAAPDSGAKPNKPAKPADNESSKKSSELPSKPDVLNQPPKLNDQSAIDIAKSKSELRDIGAGLAGDIAAFGAAFATKYVLEEKLKNFNDKVNWKERPTDSTSDDCHVRRNMDNLQELAKKLGDPDFTRLLPSLKETLKGSNLSAEMKDGKLVLTSKDGKNQETELTVDPKTGDMTASIKHYSPDRKTCLDELAEAIPVANKFQAAMKAADAYKCLTQGDKQGYYESLNGLFDAAHKARGVEGLKEAMAISKEMWTAMGAKVKEPTLRNASGDAVTDDKKIYPAVKGFSMEIVTPGGKVQTVNYETDYNKSQRKYDFDVREYLPKK